MLCVIKNIFLSFGALCNLFMIICKVLCVIRFIPKVEVVLQKKELFVPLFRCKCIFDRRLKIVKCITDRLLYCLQ